MPASVPFQRFLNRISRALGAAAVCGGVLLVSPAAGAAVQANSAAGAVRQEVGQSATAGCVAERGDLGAAAASGGRARLEPVRGAYFGANLDWAHDSAAAFAARLGRPAAVYVQFTPFPIGTEEAVWVDQFVDQVKEAGGLALLTLEPRVPLTGITPQMADDLAARLQGYNARGVPVFVRFAHEMNGSWYPWSQQPTEYVAAFRTLAAAVHARTQCTAMLWAPNYGAGYPFHGGAFEARPGTPAFALLDTNHDGTLDATDDMYAPYYPGDDAVDWVGMTLYHWGDSWPWGKNVRPEAGKFAQQLTGEYNGAGGDDRAVPDFYHEYGAAHGKPVAIPETAAFYNTTVPGDREEDIKRLWWRQVFATDVATRFPRLKMINWFEWRKPESEVQNAVVDWTLTGNPAQVQGFLQDLPREAFLFADDLAVGGDGAGAAASAPGAE